MSDPRVRLMELLAPNRGAGEAAALLSQVAGGAPVTFVGDLPLRMVLGIAEKRARASARGLSRGGNYDDLIRALRELPQNANVLCYDITEPGGGLSKVFFDEGGRLIEILALAKDAKE